MHTTHIVEESTAPCDVQCTINFTMGTLMSLREIDLQAETYYDCENWVYDLFTQATLKTKKKNFQEPNVCRKVSVMLMTG